MNRDNININSTAGDRRTYLSPRTEIIKMDTNAGMMENRSIPRDSTPAHGANGKQWQGDFDSLDEEAGSNDKSWGSVW